MMKTLHALRKIKMYLNFKKVNEIEMNLQESALGMNSSVNITEDLHIIMLDYDTHNFNKVVESISELQQFYNLAQANIYSTKNGYHVFFWYDQVPYARLRQIIDFAKYVDPMYKYISRFYDHKTIRVSGKYAKKDIHFKAAFDGKRTPTHQEIEIGELKQQEHQYLSSAKPTNSYILKSNNQLDENKA